MRYRRLGKSDLSVSEIGLGAMSLNPEDEKGSVRIIHEALDRGINFIDTADLYNHGYNEELVGKAIKDRRHKVVLATKVGNRWYPDGSGWYWDPSKAHIKNGVKASLKRLGTDYIDLYQLHGGTIEDPIDETIEAFEELKEEGAIRWYGISSIRPNVIREYVKRSNIVSVMTQYSIFDRRPEEETLELISQNGIGVIARGPLAGGLLTERWQEKLSPDGYLDHSADEVKKTMERLEKLAGSSRRLTHLALRYVLRHPAITIVLPGPRTLEQLDDILSVLETPELTEAEWNKIRQASKANRYTMHR
jgi:aryl-alcohol dehydrogenase-like predicted oxidoreductase